MGNIIKAVCAEIGKPARLMMIDIDSMEDIKAICGENFECSGYAGEEGMYDIYHPSENEMQSFNKQLFGSNYYGNMIICRMHETSISLGDNQVEYLIGVLNSPEAAIEIMDHKNGKMADEDIIQAVEKSREELHQVIDKRCNDLIEFIKNPEHKRNMKNTLELPAYFYKGRKPHAIELGNADRYIVKTWREVAKILLKDCNSNPAQHKNLMRLRNKISGRSRSILSDVPDGMNVPMKIDDNLYFEGKFDTEFLLKILKGKIFDKVGYDYSAVEIELRGNSQTISAVSDYDETQEYTEEEQGMSGMLGM